MNPQASAAETYRRATLDSAPPIKIVRMMYQGALRFLDEASRLDPASEPTPFRERLHRAEAIVVELRISLEHPVAPELCGELQRLYLFVEERIREAVEARDVAPIASARSVLETLFDGWRGIEVPDVPEAA